MYSLWDLSTAEMGMGVSEGVCVGGMYAFQMDSTLCNVFCIKRALHININWLIDWKICVTNFIAIYYLVLFLKRNYVHLCKSRLTLFIHNFPHPFNVKLFYDWLFRLSLSSLTTGISYILSFKTLLFVCSRTLAGMWITSPYSWGCHTGFLQLLQVKEFILK